eukprot:TRINITY_DN2800_c0_g1_i1.p1 TRINITY_DN2800_c0_g1~~TRINITY_DN2800_c0_g1_i1.p1  ORF type:complete len:978 (-),score=354.78 TRINITY_DN2800_c0_g1_i1:290-3223(-)
MEISIILIVSALIQLVLGNISGCSGFVKPSGVISSLIDVSEREWSDVRVKVTTSEGVVKDSLNCMPKGDFFVPIYEKGVFYLEADSTQKGWAFEPSRLQITEKNKVLCEKPIEFTITGFAVSGEITVPESCGTDIDYSNLSFKLIQNGEIIQSVDNVQNGEFRFENILPGDYVIKAIHADWEFEVDEQKFVVEFGSAEVAPFVVKGFPVFGSVIAESSPLEGVVINAHSVSDGELTTVTDSNGSFRFRNVGCGVINIIPSYKTSTSVFDLQPAFIEKTVKGSTNVGTFSVAGFSLSGAVKFLNGEAVSGVGIFVDGQNVATTNVEGIYRLQNLNVGKLSIHAEKEGFIFSSLNDFELDTNQEAFPDVTVQGFHWCGHIENVGVPSDLSFKLNRHVEVIAEDRVVASVQANESGKFCADLHVNTHYIIKPESIEIEESAGLVLASAELEVSATSFPDVISFIPSKSVISGKVDCFKSRSCYKSVDVVLSPKGRVTKAKHAIMSNDGSFKFEGVWPGSYVMSVENNDKNWCWGEAKMGQKPSTEHRSIEVEVGTEDLNGFIFKQSGHIFSARTSIPHKMKISHIDNEDYSFITEFNRGSNRLCLPAAGKYSLEPLGCFSIPEDERVYNTNSPLFVQINPLQFLVEGVIKVPADQTGPITIKAAVSNPSKPGVSSKIGVRSSRIVSTVSEEVNEDNTRDHTFSMWVNPDKVVEFTPIAPAAEHKLLFEPSTVKTRVLADTCPLKLTTISGERGLYLEGSIRPALKGVEVSIFEENSSKRTLKVKTNEEGKYSAGPLARTVKYTVEAEMEGYHFNRRGAYDFDHHRLSSLTVKVIDNTKSSVANAIVLISGEDGQIHMTTDIRGKATFTELFPGEYHVRTMLREYSFTPAGQSVMVIEGENTSVTFNGIRTSFSIMGSVKSVNGVPEKELSVVAVDSTGVVAVEETQVNDDGTFRLFGLAPKESYVVFIQQNEKRMKVCLK